MESTTSDTGEHIAEATSYSGVETEPSSALPALEIHIGTVESIVGVLVVLFTIGVAWGHLRKTVAHIEAALERFDRRVMPKLLDVRERVAAIEGKLDALWSPAERKRPSKRTRKTERAPIGR